MIVTTKPAMIHRRLGKGSVLLHSVSGEYYELNQLGTFIWETIASEPSTIQRITEAARLEFRDAPDELERDVVDFVVLLMEKDLLEISEV